MVHRSAPLLKVSKVMLHKVEPVFAKANQASKLSLQGLLQIPMSGSNVAQALKQYSRSFGAWPSNDEMHGPLFTWQRDCGDRCE